MDAGDVVLKEHFSTAARNARYHSPTAQNKLVAACGEWIQEKTVTLLEVSYQTLCLKLYSMLVPVCSQTFIVCSTSPVHYLRSTMGQERLTGLALMHVNYGMELNLDEIISILARQCP